MSALSKSGFALATVAALLVTVLVVPAAAEELPWLVKRQCFGGDALASTPKERAIVKGNHTFDAPPPVTTLDGPTAPVESALRGAIRRVALPPGQKLIALTFDLCEQPGEIAGYDGEIVDYLRAQGVKATFFAGGKWMRSHADRAAQLMSDPLFEVGNHSEAHRNLRLLSGERAYGRNHGPATRLSRHSQEPRRAPMSGAGGNPFGHHWRAVARVDVSVPLSVRRVQRGCDGGGQRKWLPRHSVGSFNGRSLTSAVGSCHRGSHEARQAGFHHHRACERARASHPRGAAAGHSLSQVQGV